MITHDSTPVPAAAPRGAVQKTFVPAKILSGFTDENHFQLLAGEYLATLSEQSRARVLAEAAASRTFVSQLPPFLPQEIIVREITGAHVDGIRADPLYQQFFGQRPNKFCYVNPSGIIALQASIEPRADRVPPTEAELLEFALPRRWDVPVEVSFIQPSGPIQLLSSYPGFQGLTLELDQAASKVLIGAPKHLNLVQVMHFQQRYYLKNGYHRVADAIAAGIQELPAVVVEAFSPMEIILVGAVFFNVGYVMNRPRPPLVQDFHTAAAITTQVRERRYGVIVNLDAKPINIGI